MKQHKINFKKLLLFGVCLLIGAGISYFTQKPRLINLWQEKSRELQELAIRLQFAPELRSMSVREGQVSTINSWYLKDGRFESSISGAQATVDSLEMVLASAKIDLESATQTFEFLNQNGLDRMHKCTEEEKCVQPLHISFEKENCGLRFQYDGSELKPGPEYLKVQALKDNWFYYCRAVTAS